MRRVSHVTSQNAAVCAPARPCSRQSSGIPGAPVAALPGMSPLASLMPFALTLVLAAFYAVGVDRRL
jgi:hypothetical protein